MTTDIYTYGRSATERVESIRGYIKALKEDLARSMTEAVETDGYFPAERLAKAANQIAEKEGALEVAHLVQYAEANEVSKDALTRMLLREAVRSADDTWSGRGNDVKRAFADGRRDAIDDAMLELIS